MPYRMVVTGTKRQYGSQDFRSFALLATFVDIGPISSPRLRCRKPLTMFSTLVSTLLEATRYDILKWALSCSNVEASGVKSVAILPGCPTIWSRNKISKWPIQCYNARQPCASQASQSSTICYSEPWAQLQCRRVFLSSRKPCATD